MAQRHQLYVHLAKPVDAELSEEDDLKRVNTTTLIMAIHEPDPAKEPADQLVQKLCIATSPITCKVLVQREDEWAELGTQFTLQVQLADMATLPSIRIQVQMAGNDFPCHIDLYWNPAIETGQTGILEWRVDMTEDKTGIQRIEFTGQRSCIIGHTNMTNQAMPSAQRQDFEQMVSDLAEGKRQKLRIRFDEVAIAREAQKELSVFLPHLQDRQLPALRRGDNAASVQACLRLLQATYGSLPRDRRDLITPFEMLDSHHPCIPLPAGRVFADLSHYVHEQILAIELSHCEQEGLIRTVSHWKHKATLQIEQRGTQKTYLVVVKFGTNVRKLVGRKGWIKRRFAHDETVAIDIDGLQDDEEREEEDPYRGRIQAVMLRNPGSKFKGHYAVFRLQRAPRNQALSDAFRDKERREIRVEPHKPSHERRTRLAAIRRMLGGEGRLHYINVILNQRADKIPYINVLSGIDANTLAKANEWLLGFRTWNSEQLGAIRGIQHSKGRVSLIGGPAGTGKSEVALAIAHFFTLCGKRVLWIAPTNSNVDHTAYKYAEWLEAMPVDQRPEVSRLYPPSKQEDVRDLTNEALEQRHVGHDDGEAITLNELYFVLNKLKQYEGKLEDGHPITRSIDVVHQVIAEALLCEDATEGEFGPRSAWSAVKKAYLDFMGPEAKISNWSDALKAFRACKNEVVRRAKFLTTTSGNAACREVSDYFAAGLTDEFVLFADEASKDVEINIVTPLFGKQQPIALYLMGDRRQLGPVNTCSQKKVITHSYNARINMAFMVRLLDEGFPCHWLTIQTRCHSSLAKPIKEVFYKDEMTVDSAAVRNLPTFDGLTEKLAEMLGPTADPDKMHFQWIQLPGKRQKNEWRSSRVKEHIDFFVHRMLPVLKEYFSAKNDMTVNEQVMLLCGYNYERNTYEDMFDSLKIPKDERPHLCTVDAAQGTEANIVILSSALVHSDDIGFLNDPRRCASAFSRGKVIHWTLGGTMLRKRMSAVFSSTMESNSVTSIYLYCKRHGLVTAPEHRPA